MNSLSEYLLHYTDLTIVTQIKIMMLLQALLIQQQKSLCTGTEFNVFFILENHEAYFSNISVTQGFHSLQIHTHKSA